MLKPFRRVVTAQTADGKSTAIFDGIAENSAENPYWPGRGHTAFWFTDEAPASLTGDEDVAQRPFKLSPVNGGSTFIAVQVMPESSLGKLDAQQRAKLMEASFAGIGATDARTAGSRHGMMHRTRSIDYVIVLSGEVTLVLDTGDVHLKTLDVVVQRGTNHAWVNHGTEPALLAAILIDAEET